MRLNLVDAPAEIYLKLENLQPIGAFKTRGAAFATAQIPPEKLAHGVVTAMRTTGAAREDYREVELNLIVKRPEGGQFPAHETTLIPASSRLLRISSMS